MKIKRLTEEEVEPKENNVIGELMNISDLKIWGLSSFALTINLMDVELSLSIFLSLAAIGYTIHKWWLLYERSKKKKN